MHSIGIDEQSIVRLISCSFTRQIMANFQRNSKIQRVSCEIKRKWRRIWKIQGDTEWEANWHWLNVIESIELSNPAHSTNSKKFCLLSTIQIFSYFKLQCWIFSLSAGRIRPDYPNRKLQLWASSLEAFPKFTKRSLSNKVVELQKMRSLNAPALEIT